MFVLYFLDPTLDLLVGLSGLILDLPYHYRLAIPGLHPALITVTGSSPDLEMPLKSPDLLLSPALFSLSFPSFPSFAEPDVPFCSLAIWI